MVGFPAWKNPLLRRVGLQKVENFERPSIFFDFHRDHGSHRRKSKDEICLKQSQDLNLFALFFQTLYTYPDNFRAFKALIAAKYSGAKVTVAKDFVFGKTNAEDKFLAKFPLGKVRLLTFFIQQPFKTSST